MDSVIRPAVVAALWLACGGQSDAVSVADTAHPMEDDPSRACVDVTFPGSSEISTGLRACPVNAYPADVFANQIEQCSGRGLGEPLPTAPCSADADCPSGASCGPSRVCYRAPQCEADSQCGPGMACVCAGVSKNQAIVSFNHCVPATCRSEAECGGYRCGVSDSKLCGTLDGFYCRTPRDECSGIADCDGGDVCAYSDADSRWRCVEPLQVCDLYL